MILRINKPLFKFLKKVKFNKIKNLFFIISLLYFCAYFLKNFSQISFEINLEKYALNILIAFLFCILSILFNAYAWKYIVMWFGKVNIKNNLVSFYVLTNILKYVPGGFWHFVERFSHLKNISNRKLAFYSIIAEPFFMLSASFFLASIGIVFSPYYLFLITPLIFLNSKLIYLILKILKILKVKTAEKLNIPNPKFQLEQKIKLNSFFPTRAFLFEIAFVLSKFFSFLICFKTINSIDEKDILFLFVNFCLSWSIGLVVPAAPSGIGVFEACFLFLVGRDIPQNVIFVSLIYFRVIATSADLLLSFPFLIKKFLKPS